VTVVAPPTKQLPEIFPSYMCSAIKKNGDRAALSMTFPLGFYSHGVVCMNLTILANKIEYLAMELFGVHIEAESGSRHILLGNGARLLLRSDLLMQGGSGEHIVQVLGLALSHGIDVCPSRMEEIIQAITRTRCVSMQITPNAEEDGNLGLLIEESEAYSIKQKLFE
jgi:hypothetical protein